MKAKIINGVDFGGLYPDKYQEEYGNLIINDELVSEWIFTDVLPSEYLIIKKWNGSEWIEGATLEEIKADKSSKLMPKLQKIFSDNELKAKAYVIDKKGSKAYIESQERHYVLKYKVAKGLIINPKITALHEIEAADLGITLEQLNYVIIWKYETSEAEFMDISGCNETCRTRIQTHLEQSQSQKAEDCLAIYQNLICEDYELLTSQILSL